MGQEMMEVEENGQGILDLSDDVDELDRGRVEEEEETPADGEPDVKDDDADEDDSTDDKDADSEEEGDVEGEADGEDDADPEEDVVVEDKTKEEISSLRQMVRAQRTQLKDVEEQLKKQNDALLDKDIITEDELTPENKEVLEQRAEVLDQMVELMELNPKFEDVKDVCTQSNFDDVAETLAKAYVSEHGGDESEVADQIAAAVWAKTNPYKEMYGLVKQYHPEFADKKSDTEGKNPLDEAKKAKKAEAKSAAPSLSNMPGGGGGKSGGTGWTSQRIDQLSEVELDDVPSDVYEQYMMGTLD